MTARLIETELVAAGFPVAVCCRVLGISTAGFYEWRAGQAEPCRRSRRDGELIELIATIHRQSRGTYGSPRVHAELRMGLDIRVGRKRVARLMRVAGLAGVSRRRRRGCTKRDPTAVPADDLVVRQFRPEGPDRLWVADITEHPTADGKVYCAVVIDAWSRMVVGHSIADHLRAELVVDALDMARWRRRPQPGQTVHHSDHGTQGELNRSSQHLDRGGACRWRRRGSDSVRFSCIEGRCRRRDGRRWRGVRTGSGSGWRSLVA
jgi:putative transposase